MNRIYVTLRCMLVFLALGLLGEPASANHTSLSRETAAPQIACNDLVHLSLDEFCFATVTPEMLLEDMLDLSSNYLIKVYYKDGSEQADLNFDATDIGAIYDFKVWHIPSGNSCWGKITIEDKFPPEMLCGNDTVRCGDGISPELLGFPIPLFRKVFIDSVSPFHYLVYDWDYCGVVKLSYNDYLYNNTCDSIFIRKIIRQWTAVDPSGNTSTCSDTICVYRPEEIDIVYPRHFDGVDLPFIYCGFDFPKLPDGNPAPSYTGWPIPTGCSTLNASFTDLRIPICGNTFKVLRRWVILNWCNGRLIEYNQIIKVIDETPPEIVCPPDFTVGMRPYACLSEGKLPVLPFVYDCNEWTYDVYTKTIDPKTGEPNEKGKDFIEYVAKEKSYYLRGAPEGRIWVIYEVTDVCGNVSECTIEVGVVDNLAPVAICDQKTVVALGIDGTAKAYAETFDDGSLDNCGIDSFQVRRMDDTCKSGTDVFGPYVIFCCADVGRTVMVAMEVKDFYGNRNTCMVEVTVQDKEPPVVIPPTNITVECSFPIDYTDLGVFGSVRKNEADRKQIIIQDSFYRKVNYIAGLDGIAYDNCDLEITETYEKDIQCNSGLIRRIFTAKDPQGWETSAIQYITIINTRPFTAQNIRWPMDREINSCNRVRTHPDQTGYPTFTNINCAQVASNYDDIKLTVLDSTCFKILRKWTVIDWCQYDRSTGKGIWERTQVIAVKNSEPPTIISCQDIEICDETSYHDPVTQECLAHFELTGEGFDDCSDEIDLIWNYRIDVYNDGSYDSIKSGRVARGVLPIGTHRILWTLTDQCGNSESCDQLFTLKDCKKPTPYCHNGVVTVIMPTTGSIIVWAKDLNLSSFDNCTQAGDLIFSFSADTSYRSIEYNCDSLNKQSSVTKTVRIYVTDESGNQDYCETTIRIQDNNNACPTSGPGLNLSGKISRENQTTIPGTQVYVKDASGNILKQAVTDFQGQYAFTNLQANSYYLSASKNDDITNGVSTLDIVLIQRHILGLKKLNSSYQILAADVNGSNTITAKDVSDIRRAILGVTTSFPNQTPVWRMIDAAHVFQNPDQPWDAPSRLESDKIAEKLDRLHFTGIKTGDVDLSAEVNLNGSQSRLRAEQLMWTLAPAKLNANGELEIAILAGKAIELEGFQLGLEGRVGGLQITSIRPEALDIASEDYRVESNRVKISWAPQHTVSVEAGQRLFTIVFEKPEGAASMDLALKTMSGFSSEAYVSGNTMTLELQRGGTGAGQQEAFAMYPIQPNPFATQALLRFELPGSGNVRLSVFDATGKTVYVRDQWMERGTREMLVSKSELNASGLLYYTLSTPFGSASEKMVIIE
ncbi:MAG TPA: carboxypeptidase regulatory-like domain-containing protein [Saprospiraceae bacterium]|nr:carboxypeptidase regulatory-like domain-containing protein [Saprospiraceae bacterium]